MKRGILPGIIKVVVVACLVVAMHQARAQEKPTAPEVPIPIVKVAKVVPVLSKLQPGFSADKVYLTGSATLAGGSVDVKFKESFSKFTSDIKVIVTPVGSWSGIYVININPDGFTAMSGAGDPKARFNWIVVRE